MAYITGNTMQGCSLPTHYLGNNTYLCEPDVGEFYRRHRIYNDYHLWYVKVTGDVGERITVRLRWPQFDPDAVSDEYKAWASYSTDWPSFFHTLHETVYISQDELTWERIEGAHLEEDAVVFSITLPSEVCYLSTILRYTAKQFDDLKNLLKASPYAQTILLDKGYDGLETVTFAVTDPTVSNESKKTVYLQALQHCHESPGGHVCDGVLRYLVSDDPAAQEIRRTFIFRVTPVVDAAGWRTGAQLHPERRGSIDFNFNRDWGSFSLPETAALARYLNECKENGERLCFLADLHGGTGDENDYSSGASISFHNKADEETLRRQLRFCEVVAQNCDYLNPAASDYWMNEKPKGLFARYAQENFGPAFTFEVSMSKIWDRAAKRRFPNSQFAYRRFAEQLTKTIAAWLAEP